MKKSEIIDSLTHYILSNPSFKTQQTHQIYNGWAIRHNVVLKDHDMLQFISSYIEDVKRFPEPICRDLSNV